MGKLKTETKFFFHKYKNFNNKKNRFFFLQPCWQKKTCFFSPPTLLAKKRLTRIHEKCIVDFRIRILENQQLRILVRPFPLRGGPQTRPEFGPARHPHPRQPHHLL